MEGNSQQTAIPGADEQPMHISLNEMMDNLEEFNWVSIQTVIFCGH